MYELHLYDFGSNHVGTYKTKDYDDAMIHYRDFLAAKFSVKMLDKDGSVLFHTTVYQ